MRKHYNKRAGALLALLALLALALAACGGAQQAAENAEVAAPGDTVVSGTVTYLDRSALPPTAVVNVELIDATIADAPATVIASQQITVGEQQAPFPFALAYDPAAVNPASRYQVRATITIDGQLRYSSQTVVPVITNGAPTSNVEVLVSPVLTEGAPGVLTGTVTYLERIALDPAAVIEVELQDVSSGTPVVVTSTQVNAAGQQVPIPFELPYDATMIQAAATYLLYGRILVNGAATWATPTGVPVLTNGAPTSNVELRVSPVATATGGSIQGTVTTARPPAQLPAGATLQVELREPMLADAPAVAQVQMPLDGMNFPFSFDLPYDSATIAADRAYVVDARVLSGGQLLYTTLAPVPVLTNGAPASGIVVPVAEVPDPAGGVLRFTIASDQATPPSWPSDSAAYLNVELREPNLADAPALAFTYIPLAGLTLPVSWEIGYPTASIDPNKAYVLDARIIDNNVLTYASTAPLPVLTQGAPANDVTLTLTPQGTGGTGGNEGKITGVITTDAPAALDPAAVNYVDFREAGTTGDPIVTISAALAGQQFPIPFEVPFVPAQIDPAKSYVVGARILLGDQVLYASAVGVPVITQGAPTTDVTVNIPPQ